MAAASIPPIPFVSVPASPQASTTGGVLSGDLRKWVLGILDGSVSTAPLVFPGYFATPTGAVPAESVVLYRYANNWYQSINPYTVGNEPSNNRKMKDAVDLLLDVRQITVTRNNGVYETVFSADRSQLLSLAELATERERADQKAEQQRQSQLNANALWNRAWNNGGFDAGYQTWLKGGARDPLRGGTGVKVALAGEVAATLRSKSEELLRINARMGDMNTVLKKLNTMAADAKSKADTEQITYAEDILMGAGHAGGNSWAANVKPLWEAWGIDTSKFSVVATTSGKGKLVIEKRYIDVAMESLKIALDKASSEAQQLQLDLNNIMTQYNGQFDAASAIYQRKNTLDQALQPRG